MSPQLRLDALIDKHGPELAAIGREAIRAAIMALPHANRIADHSDGLLRVHFAPGVNLAHTILTVSFHGYWVSYDFPQGNRMWDTDELLRRSDRGTYHYVVEGPGDVTDAEVTWLLQDAADKADPPLNPENIARLFFIDALQRKPPAA